MVAAMLEEERRVIASLGDFMTRPGAIPRKALLVACCESARCPAVVVMPAPAGQVVSVVVMAPVDLNRDRRHWQRRERHGQSFLELNIGPSPKQRLLDAFQTSVYLRGTETISLGPDTPGLSQTAEIKGTTE